jgi:four helix bundle protein
VKIEKFSDPVVWKEAHKLALAVYKLTSQFPETERFGIVAQVRRSAASICANIAEGYGRRTTKELLRSLQIARGELEETRYFLILGRDLGLVDVKDFEKLNSQCDVVGKLLSALSRSLREKLPA